MKEHIVPIARQLLGKKSHKPLKSGKEKMTKRRYEAIGSVMSGCSLKALQLNDVGSAKKKPLG